MNRLIYSCLILFLIVFSIRCKHEHSLCKDITLVERWEKGKTNKYDKVKAAIVRIEEATQIISPQDGSYIGILYYPDSITIDLWKKKLESKQINCY